LRIEVGREAIGFTWADGTTTRADASDLRRSCPCAACAGAPTQAFAVATIASARIVGDYAVGITFDPDGHATGIFPYDLLRTLGDAA